MAVQWHWIIFMSIFTWTLAIHDNNDVLPTYGEYMCQSCSGNLWYDVRTEECTPQGNAVMSSVPKLRQLISQVISTYSTWLRETMLSLFLHQLLGGYIPDCPLECYGEDEDTVMYICSFIGNIAIEDFGSYLHTNMNASQQENRNVEEFLSYLHTFRKGFCSSTVQCYGLVKRYADIDDIGEDELSYEGELSETIDDDQYSQQTLGETIVKHEKRKALEDGIWLTISVVSLGFLFVAVVSKMCVLLHGMKKQQHKNISTKDSSRGMEDGDDDSVSLNSQFPVGFGSDLNIKGSALTLNSLCQEQIVLPVAKPEIYMQDEEALSMESGLFVVRPIRPVAFAWNIHIERMHFISGMEDGDDDSVSLNSQFPVGFGSDLNIKGSALTLNSLCQEQIVLPVAKPEIYMQDEEALSMESGSIEDVNMGPYPTASFYGEFGRPGRNIAR